jgi:hypothetical protein
LLCSVSTNKNRKEDKDDEEDDEVDDGGGCGDDDDDDDDDEQENAKETAHGQEAGVGRTGDEKFFMKASPKSL